MSLLDYHRINISPTNRCLASILDPVTRIVSCDIELVVDSPSTIRVAKAQLANTPAATKQIFERVHMEPMAGNVRFRQLGYTSPATGSAQSQVSSSTSRSLPTFLRKPNDFSRSRHSDRSKDPKVSRPLDLQRSGFLIKIRYPYWKQSIAYDWK